MGRELDEPWVWPDGTDTYLITFPDWIRAILVELGGELRSILGSNDDTVWRVFPTAYPDDPERDAGYQALIRGELIDRHQAGVDLIVATAGNDTLTGEQLATWMTTINALRLILGTALGLTDDDSQVDPNDPRWPVYQLYTVLNVVIGHIVMALSESL